MENMREGTVTVGVDYFVNLIEENAAMRAQIDALGRLLVKEDSNLIYTKNVSAVFGFDLAKGPKVWTNVQKGADDES